MANKETGSNNLKPDYGVYVSKNMAGIPSFGFMPFSALYLARVGDTSYTTGSVWVHGNKEYCLTIDFDQEAYLKLLSVLPEGLSDFIKKEFNKPFKGHPSMVNFSSLILLNIKAKPGQKTTNGDEEFIPFAVTDVSLAGELPIKAPPAADESVEKKMITELAKALYKIGRTDGFISPKGKLNPEAIKIGEALNKLGGITAMMSAARTAITSLRVAHNLDLAGELNHCWNGIGEWMA